MNKSFNTQKSKKAQGLVEYLLLVALIGLAVLAIVRIFGTNVKQGFTDAAQEVSTISSGSTDK